MSRYLIPDRLLLVPRPMLQRLADGLALAMIVSLPYSTTATGVLVAAWVPCVLATIDRDELRVELRAPRSLIAVLLVLAVAIGLLWSVGTARDNWAAVSSPAKLLALPLLFLQFRREDVARRALFAYVLALLPVLVLSYAAIGLRAATGSAWPLDWSLVVGVPFKDYIAQAAFFLFAAFLVAHRAVDLWTEERRAASLAASALAFAFVANLVVVMTSRTALVVLPFLVVLFAFQRLAWRKATLAALAGLAVVLVAFLVSPQLQTRLASVGSDLAGFEAGEVTSAGLRVDWYRRSLNVLLERPLTGLGTGSTREMLVRGQNEVARSVATPNPHNQLLWFGVQIGIAGIVLLLALWAAHARLFTGRDFAAYVGMGFLVQAVITAQFNSTLTDFTAGWFYIFCIGVLGGLVLRERQGIAT